MEKSSRCQSVGRSVDPGVCGAAPHPQKANGHTVKQRGPAVVHFFERQRLGIFELLRAVLAVVQYTERQKSGGISSTTASAWRPTIGRRPLVKGFMELTFGVSVFWGRAGGRSCGGSLFFLPGDTTGERAGGIMY